MNFQHEMITSCLMPFIVVRTWTGPDLDRGPGPRSRTFGKVGEGPGPAAYFHNPWLPKQHAALMTAL